MPLNFVTYDPTAPNPAPVLSMRSGTAPNPVAVHTLTSTEQGYIQANDPLSIVVDPSTGAVSANANFWTLRGAYYKGLQIGSVTGGFQKALAAPYAFTNAAGVASTYAMDSGSQFIYSQAYANYVLGGEALPSGFTIRDSNGIPQTFAVADIKGLYTGIISFVQTCNTAFNGLVANINGSTSLSNCQSYVWVTP